VKKVENALPAGFKPSHPQETSCWAPSAIRHALNGISETMANEACDYPYKDMQALIKTVYSETSASP
jgi:hypothetical protein